MIRVKEVHPRAKVETFLGDVHIVKEWHLLDFYTLFDLQQYFNSVACYATQGSRNDGDNVVMFPAAVLATDFDERHEAWGKLHGLPRLPLTRAARIAATLVSQVG